MSKTASRDLKLPIKVNRKTPPPALQPFTDYFKGFEKVAAVRKVFGDDTEAVLARLKIGFISNRRMYMGIRDDDGNVAVGTYHLRHSTNRVLYLDIVHELFHIKQWMRDKEWFTREHEKFMGNFALYYSSPLEVPAYAHTVREAERLGMTRKEIAEYLKMMPVPQKVWNRFLKEMAIKPPRGPRRGEGPEGGEAPRQDQPEPQARPPPVHRLLPGVRGRARRSRPCSATARRRPWAASRSSSWRAPSARYSRARRTATWSSTRATSRRPTSSRYTST